MSKNHSLLHYKIKCCKLLSVLTFFLIFSSIVNAQYVTNLVTGDYDVTSSWSGGVIPGNTPNDKLTIVLGSDISKVGDLSVSQGLYIYGNLSIDGILTAGSNSVYVGTDTNNNANLTVSGDLNLSTGLDIYGNVTVEGSINGGNGITVRDGATLIVDGNLTTSQPITVEKGGALIVNGTLTTGNLITINGDLTVDTNFVANGYVTVGPDATVIIEGDLSTSNYLDVDGNVIIKGDYTVDGGLGISENGNVVVVGDLDVNQNWGNTNIAGENTDNLYVFGDTDIAPGINNDLASGGGSSEDFATNEKDSGLYDELVSLGLVIESPQSFSATSLVDDNAINLSWTLNSSSDTIIIAYALDGVFGIPKSGTKYSEGSLIEGNGIVLKISSSDNSILHTPLKYGTAYYYKAWSVRNGKYSIAKEANATTITKATSLVALVETWGDSDEDTGVEWSASVTQEETKPVTNPWDDGASSSRIGSSYWSVYGDAISNNNGHSAYITYNTWEWYYGTLGWQWYPTNHGANYNSDVESNDLTLSCLLDLTLFDADDVCKLSFDWLAYGTNNEAYGMVYINGASVNSLKYFSDIEPTTWQTESIDLSAYKGQTVALSFVWNNQAGGVQNAPGFCVDNIIVSNATTTVTQVNGSDIVNQISSVANTTEEAENVLDFYFTDEANTSSTIVEQIIINQGDNNEISDWSSAISGAELRIGNATVATGVVGVNNITFTFSNGLEVADGTSSENYQLYIWLNTELNNNGINDGDNFDFMLATEDIITGTGDDFETLQSFSSGAIPLDISATTLSFITEPSSIADYEEVLDVSPVVAATDKNGNIDTDIDWVLTTVTNSADILMEMNATGAPSTSLEITISNGTAAVNDLTFYGENAVTITLVAEATILIDGAQTVISAESSEIVIYQKVYGLASEDFYINSIVFGDISNSSGSDYQLSSTGGGPVAYGDYTALSTSVTVGQTYSGMDVTVKNAYKQGNGGNAVTYDGYVFVYIDWNLDGDFEDDNEECLVSEIVHHDKNNIISLVGLSFEVPQDAVIGTSRMRIVFNAVAEGAASSSISTIVTETEDYTIEVQSQKQMWTGAISSNWNDTTNWSLLTLPTEGSDVTIIGGLDNYPVMSGTVTINHLNIGSGATVTVLEGTVLTVKGDLTGVDNGLIIQNSDTRPVSLIVEGTANPKVSVAWTYAENGRWWYIGHGVSGFTNEAYISALSGTNDYKLYLHNNGYSRINASSNYSFNSPMMAYALMIKNANSTVQYSGNLNLGTYTYALGSKQDYLIANPYTSYIDLTSSGFDYGNAQPTIYTMTTYNGIRGFATYNIQEGEVANGGSKYVAPGQSFWVVVSDEADAPTEVRIEPSARSQGDGASLKSASTISKDVLRVSLTSNYSTDELVLIFGSQYGSVDYTKADSRKKFSSGNTANLYTVKDGVSSVIVSLPAINGTEEIPLAYKVESSGMGQFTFYFEGANQLKPAYKPFLLDEETGVMVDLQTVNKYDFIPGELNSEDRFSIIFEKSNESDITTQIEESMFVSQKVKVYKARNHGVVEIDKNLLSEGEAIINIFDIKGTKIKTLMTSEVTTEFTLGRNNALYLIEVEVSGRKFVQKLVN